MSRMLEQGEGLFVPEVNVRFFLSSWPYKCNVICLIYLPIFYCLLQNSVVVSNLRYVDSIDAEYLCVFDLIEKIQRKDVHFDIGGTHSDSKPELWFYFSTTISATGYLMNLFVCHRKVGNLEIRVPTKYNLSSPVPVISEDQMSVFNFHTAQPDDHHYIKSYCFQSNDIRENKHVTKHYLPIRIKTVVDRTIDPEITRLIKLKHSISSLMRKEKPDLTLISSSGARYEAHKIVLLAHSTVLREKLNEPTLQQSLQLDVTDEAMEVLLHFLYTGTVDDISKQDKSKLLELSGKFKLSNLQALAHTMS